MWQLYPLPPFLLFDMQVSLYRQLYRPQLYGPIHAGLLLEL